MALDILQEIQNRDIHLNHVSYEYVLTYKQRLTNHTYHEERVGRLNKTLEFVLLLLQLHWRIQQINIVRKNLNTHTYQNLYNKADPDLRKQVMGG